MSRVLIVDDDPSLAWIAQAALTRFGGHLVTTSSSADQALALLDREPFDVVLLDAMMPHVDGPDLLRTLREHPRLRDVPVVMLTALAADADRERFRALGARGLLTKPFDPRTLAANLAAILERG
jgi:CheY-like chemotaxis protein